MRDIIISKVISKLKLASDTTKMIYDLAKKYNKLTPEDAIAYSRNFEKYHNFKIPEKPQTKKIKNHGEDIILVEIEGKDEKYWYPVWIDNALGGLYGEY